MTDTFFSQIRSRGEEFLTEVSNNLMSNPAFIEVLKKGVAAKEEIDKRVAEALKTMNVATPQGGRRSSSTGSTPSRPSSPS